MKHLQQVAGVPLGASDLAALTDLATIYHERFRGEPPGFIPDEGAPNERDARRAFVQAVWETWNDCRRRRERRPRDDRRLRNKDKQPAKPAYDAQDKHCINLLRELLIAAGEKELPSSATLRHDLRFIWSGRERRHT